MYLKRIELFGFKSFADRTELEFVPGITAVVGPNGSGKSNISDSIRWVLGEQSAKSLRGGKMEDVIFAGSDTRRPVNYGEVSLTLDNSDQALPLDFSEVTITRRIHRSGESEYLINKQPCRLRDITELFMDTGIGKEAYSIIGQGKIEEILSSKAEDRRGIFEEASGIVKYKTRKKEAQKKLEETEQNLLRIQDLIAELESQIAPLKEQADKALKYKQLAEQLKSKEISLHVYQIKRVHEAWKKAGERLAELEQKQLELSAAVNRQDAGLETYRFQLGKLDEELERLQAELLQLSENTEKCEGQGEVLKERAQNLHRNREALLAAIAVSDRRIAELEDEHGQLVRKHEQAEEQFQAITAQLAGEENRLSALLGNLSGEAEERLKGELLEILNQMAQTRNEIRYNEQQLESLQRRLDKLDEEKGKWAAQKEDKLRERRETEDALQRIGAELAAVRDEFLRQGEKIKAKQHLLDECLLTLRKWEQKHNALLSRRDTMREMENDYDGYFQGVKEVLKARGKTGGLRGVHGAVAELIQVPAEVEIAIETALGSALQHVVMEDEAASREAIKYLKERRLGRATFLPLDVIQGRHIPEAEVKQIEHAEGFVGLAADCIEFDARYQNIISSLLGQVIIAQTLEMANRIAAKCRYRYRVVTLDGDVVNAGGSMTGGSLQKKNTGLLSRRRQMEEMEREIAASREHLHELQERAEKLKEEVASEQNKLEDLRRSGEQKRIEEQQYSAQLRQLDSALETVEAQLAVYSQDRGALEAERGDYEQGLQTLHARLHAIQREEARLQQAIQDAEMSRKEMQEEKERLQAKVTDLKVKSAALSQEKQSLAGQVQRLREEIAVHRGEWAKNRQALADLEAEIAANETKRIEQTAELNELKLKKEACGRQIEFSRAERTKIVEKLAEEEGLTKEQRDELRKVEEQLHRTEVEVNRLDVELENLLKKLADDHGLSFELAAERYPEPDNAEAQKAEVSELKRQIALLGDVNLGAIEEYKRVSERYAFLNGQKADLVEAKQNLYRVIKEMDEEMSKRFVKTFQEIRSQFMVVFAKLFGGGRADLVLSNPDNLLETGVDIVAQPPGKKLTNLQLLSGGERALTALSLLFAILHVKPVPFCVLDEVEAALDEANVSRFAQYLREFSQQTQFIVVTHRKGTMEEADVLYGVSMENDGVSKLVSVRLSDDEAITA